MSITDNDFASFYPSSIKIVDDRPPFEKVDEGTVDGEPWITVCVRNNDAVAKWLRANGAVETSAGWAFRSYFDLPEQLYALLVLKWS